MSGSLTSGGGKNVPGIPGACATRNFSYLARGPLSEPVFPNWKSISSNNKESMCGHLHVRKIYKSDYPEDFCARSKYSGYGWVTTCYVIMSYENDGWLTFYSGGVVIRSRQLFRPSLMAAITFSLPPEALRSTVLGTWSPRHCSTILKMRWTYFGGLCWSPSSASLVSSLFWRARQYDITARTSVMWNRVFILGCHCEQLVPVQIKMYCQGRNYSLEIWYQRDRLYILVCPFFWIATAICVPRGSFSGSHLLACNDFNPSTDK